MPTEDGYALTDDRMKAAAEDQNVTWRRHEALTDRTAASSMSELCTLVAGDDQVNLH